MPLLALEPSVFPEDLLSNPSHVDQSKLWWVLHSRPRTEKCLARRFFRAGVAFYLPLYERRWRTRGRLLTAHMPLFPGYVFVHGDRDVRVTALETNLVANVIPVGDQHQLHADLVRVHRLLVSGSSVTPEQQLAPGTPVEVIAGPLAGLQGKVLHSGKAWRFFIEVRLLQRGVSVEIDRGMVRPLQTHAQPGRPAARCG
jgi:transcriptional antiterminator RfaH